jgi:manganese catalase
MYHHVKKLMYSVHVDTPDPRFGNMLLEPLGGVTGELAAAMQYSLQGLNCDDPALKDLLMDVGTEEFSHLEIVGVLARWHLQPMKFDRERAELSPLVALACSGGINLFNSQGNPWTADYLAITGELEVDLRSNIAAEARTKIMYERLINFTVDAGTKDALQFLMTREVAHLKAFTAALESLSKPSFMIGRIPPTAGLVDQFFNTSTGEGDDAEIDMRGPWNQGDTVEFVDAPALQVLVRHEGSRGEEARLDDRTTSSARQPELIEELLVERLRDLVHAESQLVHALPKMSRAARSLPLKLALENHLEETKLQVRRLMEAFALLGEHPKGTMCRGMRGLVDEGEEVIETGREQEDVAADLALIAVAEKIEHYEISAYETARAMAGQIGLPTVTQLLNKSLAEEEITDSALAQLARELMSQSRTGEPKMPKHVQVKGVKDSHPADADNAKHSSS